MRDTKCSRKKVEPGCWSKGGHAHRPREGGVARGAMLGVGCLLRCSAEARGGRGKLGTREARCPQLPAPPTDAHPVPAGSASVWLP